MKITEKNRTCIQSYLLNIRYIDFVLIVVALFLPFELIINGLIYNLFHNIFNEYYIYLLLGYVFVYLFLLSNVFLVKINKLFFLICTVFLFCGFWELITTYLNGGNLKFAFTQLIVGFLFPYLLFIILFSRNWEKIKSFFRIYYFSTIFLILISFFFIFYYYDFLPDWYKEKDMIFKLISFKFAFDPKLNISNGMQFILGNFNKASNTFILMLLFATKFFDLNIKRDRLYLKIILIIFTLALLLMFSRLALMLYPFVLYFSKIHKCFSIKKYKLILSIIFIAFIIKFWSFISFSLDYLLFSKFGDVESDQSGFLGTGNGRIKDWQENLIYFSEPSIWLKGIGLGQYGKIKYGDIQLGTHNLFLDHFISSGIFIPLSILIIVFFTLIFSLYKQSYVIFIGMLIFVILSFREYSFSYLWVTSNGSFIFLTIILLLFLDNKIKSSHNISLYEPKQLFSKK